MLVENVAWNDSEMDQPEECFEEPFMQCLTFQEDTNFDVVEVDEQKQRHYQRSIEGVRY
jgi:hypothetical protein